MTNQDSKHNTREGPVRAADGERTAHMIPMTLVAIHAVANACMCVYAECQRSTAIHTRSQNNHSDTAQGHMGPFSHKLRKEHVRKFSLYTTLGRTATSTRPWANKQTH